jgi:hypothetical protein
LAPDQIAWSNYQSRLAFDDKLRNDHRQIVELGLIDFVKAAKPGPLFHGGTEPAIFVARLGHTPDALLMAVTVGAGHHILTAIGHRCNTLAMARAAIASAIMRGSARFCWCCSCWRGHRRSCWSGSSDIASAKV